MVSTFALPSRFTSKDTHETLLLPRRLLPLASHRFV